MSHARFYSAAPLINLAKSLITVTVIEVLLQGLHAARLK